MLVPLVGCAFGQSGVVSPLIMKAHSSIVYRDTQDVALSSMLLEREPTADCSFSRVHLAALLAHGLAQRVPAHGSITDAVYFLRITVPEIEATRSIFIPGGATFKDLRDTISAALGWDGPWGRFMIGPVVVANTRDLEVGIPLNSVRLADVNFKPEDKFSFEFDAWRLEISVEDIFRPTGWPDRRSRNTVRLSYPICVYADGQAPSEELYGPEGFLELKRQLAGKQHLDRDLRKAWRAKFPLRKSDLLSVNKRLRKVHIPVTAPFSFAA
jgi:Plasmid pRiA4b ORF-3-like protein